MSWRSRKRREGWGGFAPYVPVAEKMRLAEQAKAKLKKKGVELQPVVLTGRAIARTWWGQAWNENLERYADYSNRLPRGRSYARNGSVLDLRITATTITAIVAGSRPKPYEIAIRIKPLDKKVEKALMAKSREAMDSLQSLLSGEFPAALKNAFLEKGTGLFPTPQEIEFSCSCPDWAAMCKHVAAALYGTAARLDERPELFFVLRGINMDDFVGQMVAQERKKMLRKTATKSDRVIGSDTSDISKLFGIAMDGGESKKARVQRTKKAAADPGDRSRKTPPSKPEKKKKAKSGRVTPSKRRVDKPLPPA